MEFMKMTSNGDSYSYKDASSVGMNILGNFFISDIRCGGRNFFRDWVLSDENSWAVSGNITVLEKVDDDIYLTDQYSQEETPTELKISRQQLVNLIDEWGERVCKNKPKEVIIKYENDQFIIETNN